MLQPTSARPGQIQNHLPKRILEGILQSDVILSNGLGGRELPPIRAADGTILKVNVHALISCTMESPVMQRLASRRSASLCPVPTPRVCGAREEYRAGRPH